MEARLHSDESTFQAVVINEQSLDIPQGEARLSPFNNRV